MPPINNLDTTDKQILLHPNGKQKVTTKNRPLRNDYVLSRNVFPDSHSGRLLDGFLHSFLIKQEQRMGWPNVSACSETLNPHPNESVASHQWGVSFMVMVLSSDPKFKEEFPDFDFAKAMSYALLHDLAELKTGDITPRDGISPEDKHKREGAAMKLILARFPESIENSLSQLYNAYEDRQCMESKFVKDCDKLDFMIHAFLLERQGFESSPPKELSNFYVNTCNSGFFSKIAEDLANTLTRTRTGLLEKNLLYERGCQPNHAL